MRLWKKLLDLLIALYGSSKTSPWNETSKICEKYEFDESGKVFELKKIENFWEGVVMKWKRWSSVAVDDNRDVLAYSLCHIDLSCALIDFLIHSIPCSFVFSFVSFYENDFSYPNFIYLFLWNFYYLTKVC